MDNILHDLIYLNYGIYGTIVYLGHAEICPSTVSYEKLKERVVDMMLVSTQIPTLPSIPG